MQHSNTSFLKWENNDGGTGVGISHKKFFAIDTSQGTGRTFLLDGLCYGLLLQKPTDCRTNINSVIRKRKHQQEYAGTQELLPQVLSGWLDYMQIRISIKITTNLEKPRIAHVSIQNLLVSYYWNCWLFFPQFNSSTEVVKIISNNIVTMPNSYCLHFTSICAHNSTSLVHNAKNKRKLQCSSCSHSY